MSELKKIIRPLLLVAIIGIMAGCIISHHSDQLRLPSTDTKYRRAVERLNSELASVSNGDDIEVDSAEYAGNHTIRFFYTLKQNELSAQARKELINQLDSELNERFAKRRISVSHSDPLTFEYVYRYPSGKEAFTLRLPPEK